jgi:hypothetical protein
MSHDALKRIGMATPILLTVQNYPYVRDAFEAFRQTRRTPEAVS